MKLPMFVRKQLWKRTYLRQLMQIKPIASPEVPAWLVLYDGRDAQQAELARLICERRHPLPCRCIGYEPLGMDRQVIPLWKKELNNRLQAPAAISEMLDSETYDFVIMLAPSPEPTLRSLAARAKAAQRLAVNPAKNDELYRLVFTWPECDAETAVQRLFGQLKTFFSHAI